MKTPKQPDHAARARSTEQASIEQASRRRFTKAVAAALVAAPLVAASSDAQVPPATREAPAPPNPQATPTPAASPSPTPQPPSPLALALMEVARLRFGEGLKPEELKRVQGELEGNVRTADRLRAAKLQNSDEPDFTFIA